MTGEMAMGRSMRVASSFLPRNENRVTSQAMQRPSAVLTATATAVASTVSPSALTA